MAGGSRAALQWYGERQEHLADQQTLGLRMAAVAATAPALQAQLAGWATARGRPARCWTAPTDAVAGAALQQALQDMAARVGASITSAEALPAETVGPYRRIGLHVTANGGWPVIVALFGAVAQATRGCWWMTCPCGSHWRWASRRGGRCRRPSP